MPRLVRGPRERNIEPQFDDLVILAQDRLAHGDEPRMRHDVDEAADPLGMDLDVESLRAARQRAFLNALRFGEQGLDILAQRIGPLNREGAFEADDPVPVQAAHDLGGVISICHADGGFSGCQCSACSIGLKAH